MNKDLNKFLSNLAVMTFKLHNLHWNLVGINFVQLHEYTEKLYDQTFEQFDEVAEILKMKGETPSVKLSEYLKIASIKEIDAKPFTAAEVLKVLKADIQEMASLADKIRKAAGKADDFQVSTVFEDYLKSYAKTQWFLNAMIAK
jgi:DNA-binding ferritin-like protein (oxidative damage protectant)